MRFCEAQTILFSHDARERRGILGCSSRRYRRRRMAAEEFFVGRRGEKIYFL